MRSLDWSQTLLGSVANWSQSLRTALSICLNSPYPAFILWDREYAALYNDACRPLLNSSKHSQFLGQSAKNCWAEIWDAIAPLADTVLERGESTCSEDLQLLVERNGYWEEAYFAFSYSPVRDESSGVGGVFCTVMETTERVLCERRLQTLRELAADAAQAQTVEHACQKAANTLARNPADIPFALLYSLDAEGKQARLMGSTGIAVDTPASRDRVDLTELGAEMDSWSLAQVQRTNEAVIVDDLKNRFYALPEGIWTQAPHSAIVIPIARSSSKQQLAGFLVLGLSHRRKFDDEYRGFVDLIASHVTSAIANADASQAECKQIEEALRQSDERFRLVTRAVIGLVYDWDVQTNMVYRSEGLYDLIGIRPEDVPPTFAWWQERIHPDDLAYTQQLGRSILADNSDRYECEYRVRHEDGRWLDVWDRGYMFRNADGELLRVVGFTAEMTERKQAEAERERLMRELAAERSHFEAVLRQMPAGVLIADAATGQLTLANEQVNQILDHSYELNFQLQEYDRMVQFNGFDSHGRRYEPDEWPLVRSLRSGEVIADEEIEIWRCDGSRIFIEVNSAPIRDSQGQIVAAVAIFQDISDRKRAEIALQQAHEQLSQQTIELEGANQDLEETLEELQIAQEELRVQNENLAHAYRAVEIERQRYANLFNFAPDGYLITDAWGRIQEANQAAADLLSVNQQYLVGTLLVAHVFIRDRRTFRNHLYELSRSCLKQIWECILQPPQGNPFPALITASAIYDSQDRFVGTRWLIRDISDRKLAESALRESEEKYRSIFENAGVSIWEEDFTQVKAFVDRLKSLGIIDIREYLNDRPEELQRAIELVRIRDVNPQTLKLFGAKTKTELLASLANIFVPETAGAFLEEIVALAEGRRYFETETILKTLQGERRHVLFTITFPTPEIGYDRVLVSILDISALKHTEAALRQSQERLNIALKSAPLTLFNQDRELRYTWIYNPALGYEVDEVIGKRDDELLLACDAAAVTQIKRRVLETGMGTREEVKISWQGQDFYYDLTVEPLRNVNHEIVGITCAAVDISDRKHVELALRKSETLLNAFFAGSPVGLAFLDRDLRYVHANEALAAVNGLPLEAHLGHTLWEVLPDWAPQIAEILQQVMESKEPLLGREFSGRATPSAAYRHCLVNFYPVYLSDGEVLGVGVTLVDITELKQTERALRESEAIVKARAEELETFMETVPVAVWIARDPQCHHTIANRTAYELIRLLPGSIATATPAIGKYPFSFKLQRNGQDVPPSELPMQQAARMGREVEEEIEFVFDDGDVRSVYGKAVPLRDESGGVLGAIGAYIDVSDRKQTEKTLRENAERLNLALAAAYMGDWSWDVATDIVTYSEQAAAILGIPPGSNMTWTQIRELMHEEDRDRARLAVERAIQTCGDYDIEYRIIRPNGVQCWISAKGRAQYDSSGRAIGMIGVVQDITERKQTELRLREQASELSQLNATLTETMAMLAKRNQELDRFVYIVSHDLKAPLRAIANLSQWIEEDLSGQLPQDNQHQMDLLRQRVYRMESLIDGLLQYSRVGRTEVATESVDVGELLDEVLDSLAPPATFTISVRSPMPTIVAKRLLLTQVFANLIGNAIKHHHRPDGCIEIAATDKGDYYEFTVTDDGPGIAPEHHDRVFGIFQTLKSRDKQENTGIGLSIVKKILETEGGEITLKSQLGDGTTFCFTWLKQPRNL
jgi:PAS domain S-box-containing protein